MKKAYEEKLQSQLDEWNAGIEKLKARADKAKADAKTQYHEQTEKFREQQQEEQAKPDGFRRAGEDAWEDLKAEIENSRDSLERAIKTAALRYEQCICEYRVGCSCLLYTSDAADE